MHFVIISYASALGMEDNFVVSRLIYRLEMWSTFGFCTFPKFCNAVLSSQNIPNCILKMWILGWSFFRKASIEIRALLLPAAKVDSMELLDKQPGLLKAASCVPILQMRAFWRNLNVPSGSALESQASIAHHHSHIGQSTQVGRGQHERIPGLYTWPHPS